MVFRNLTIRWADQFRNRLTALVPQIKAVVGTPSGDEAKLKASEAGVFARKMDFVQANALLDQAETALKHLFRIGRIHK